MRNDCKVFQFCRPKCHKAFLKKRNPRKTKWTKAFRKSAGKEMKVDSTYEFEKRRNVPVRYDRDLMTATISAMKRVTDIRTEREKRFYEQRMKGRKTAEKEAHKLEIAKSIDLVAPAVVRATKSKAELNAMATTKVAAKSKRAAKAGAAMEED